MRQIGVAKITDRKRINNRQTSLCVCVATCSLCGHPHKVAFGGWSVLACHGCGADIYRHYKTASRMIEQAKAEQPEAAKKAEMLECLKWAANFAEGARDWDPSLNNCKFNEWIRRCNKVIEGMVNG